MSVSVEEFRTRFPAIAQHASQADVEALLDALTLLDVPRDEILVKDGDHTHNLYLVLDGRLVAYIADDRVGVELGHVTPGQWLGEVSMLDPGPSTATVKAETDCRVLVLSSKALRTLDTTHPLVTSNLLRALCALLIDRLEASDTLLLADATAAEGTRDKGQRGSVAEWATNIYRRLMHHRGTTT